MIEFILYCYFAFLNHLKRLRCYFLYKNITTAAGLFCSMYFSMNLSMKFKEFSSYFCSGSSNEMRQTLMKPPLGASTNLETRLPRMPSPLRIV